MKSLALTVSSLAVGLGLGSITPWTLRCPPLEDSISLKNSSLRLFLQKREPFKKMVQ